MPKMNIPKDGVDELTEIVYPNQKVAYRFGCCDCGLVHDIKFDVVKVRRSKSGWFTRIDKVSPC